MISMNMNFTWKQAETLSPGQLAIQAVELATKVWVQFVKFALVSMLGAAALGLVVIVLGAILPAKLTLLISFTVAVLYWSNASLALIRLSLALVDGKKLTLKETFAFDGKLILTTIVAGLLFMMAVLLGTLALVIPGLMILIGCGYFAFILVDKKDLGPVQALKASWALTNGDLLNLMLINSAITVILYLAILPAYEIFVVMMVLGSILSMLEIGSTVLAVIMGVISFVVGAAVICWVILVSMGAVLTGALAYRKLSVSRARAVEAALKA